jgi:hypothetical protein
MQLTKGVAAAALVFTFAAAPAHAELVTNGGFETGDLTGYTVDPAGIGFVGADAESPYAGTYGAYFAGTDPSAPDTISQTLQTIPGATYRVSFFLQNEEADVLDNMFLARFANVALLDLSNAAAFGYRQFSSDVTATGNQSVLSFTGYNAPAAFDLDNVSVTSIAPVVSVPEPGTAILLGIGLAGLLHRRRREAPLESRSPQRIASAMDFMTT